MTKITDTGETFDLDEQQQRGAVLFAHRLRGIVDHVGAEDEDLEGLIAAARDGFEMPEEEPEDDGPELWEDVVYHVRTLLQLRKGQEGGNMFTPGIPLMTPEEAFSLVTNAIRFQKDFYTEQASVEEPTLRTFFPSVTFESVDVSPDGVATLKGEVAATSEAGGLPDDIRSQFHKLGCTADKDHTGACPIDPAFAYGAAQPHYSISQGGAVGAHSSVAKKHADPAWLMPDGPLEFVPVGDSGEPEKEHTGMMETDGSLGEAPHEAAVSGNWRDEDMPSPDDDYEPRPHKWKPSEFSVSDHCDAMVMRNGGGDTCGLLRSDPIHISPDDRILDTDGMVIGTRDQVEGMMKGRGSKTLTDLEMLEQIADLQSSLASSQAEARMWKRDAKEAMTLAEHRQQSLQEVRRRLRSTRLQLDAYEEVVRQRDTAERKVEERGMALDERDRVLSQPEHSVRRQLLESDRLLREERSRPRLGAATTAELISELSTRIRMAHPEGMNYRTVDSH